MNNSQKHEHTDALILPAEDIQLSEPQLKPESRIKAAIKKPGLYLSEAMRTIKGRDLETLVEEFSSDVTLVLGGLSDDQERLGRENEHLQQQLGTLEKRIKELEKKLEARPEKESLVRRLTWLAAIFFGGTALLFILKFLLA